MVIMVDYVIVQAGGRGSRLRHHTWNKPKCLVSVDGKPILYHCFSSFHDCKFIVIGDYYHDVLESYLQVNHPGVEYSLIKAEGSGTASGIKKALAMIPKEASVVLTWSDLILDKKPIWPETDKPIIVTTAAFTCRWTISPDGVPRENPGSVNGIPGLFYFPTADTFPVPPESGEFVKWLSANLTDFDVLNFDEMRELGDFSTIEESNNRVGFSRFFNKVSIEEEYVTKEVVDHRYDQVHANEVAWYKSAREMGFKRIPKILEDSPLKMQKISGRHAYQMHDLSEREKRAVLCDYLDTLSELHEKHQFAPIREEVSDVYINKTFSRVEQVRKVLPGFDRDSITINGKKCRNFFADKHRHLFESLIDVLMPRKFVPIHGDPTFSNSLVDENLRVWFIDPRGYFSKPGIMGDALYDFSKIYYSAVGGYDIFNRKKFKLHVDSETVEILMDEPIFQNSAKEIFKQNFGSDMAKIDVLHGLIWLSLSGYAIDDLDSVIASFYNGLYWLETGVSRL